MSSPVDIRVPSSKSETHRALLLGALSAVPCAVHHPLMGQDCQSTLTVLQQLGAHATVSGPTIQFQPIHDLQAPAGTLDCGNSGTTLRLILAQVARLATSATLTGDASLQTRPNSPLLEALAALGARSHSETGRAPVTICGPLRAGEVVLPPQVSSQYASALLLALSLVPGDSQLHLHAPVASRPYLDITQAVAAEFGIQWQTTEHADGLRFEIEGGQRPSASQIDVAGDWSAAAFPLVAATLLGRSVRLHGLRPNSAQGDRRLTDILTTFGQKLHWQNSTLTLTPAPIAGGGQIDLGATPDLFPALAVLAACAEGPTRLAGAPSLRDKECDRITAMVDGLRALGADLEELADGVVVAPHRGLHGGRVRSHHDHRIHMAFRVLDLHLRSRQAGVVDVDGHGCAAVSYPDFDEDLRKLASPSQVDASFPHLPASGSLPTVEGTNGGGAS
jgi:3-phosphoshikimate 1-carboxyvinyltransferase